MNVEFQMQPDKACGSKTTWTIIRRFMHSELKTR